MILHTLFPTPVLQSSIERELTKTELDFVKKVEMKPNVGNRTSKNTEILNCEEMNNIREFIISCVNVYAKDILKFDDELELYITQSWLNHTKKGQYHHRHFHSNSFLSGVFYFQTVSDSDNINFEIPGKVFTFNCKEYNPFNSINWRLPAQVGHLLLFPSTLEHSVDQITINKTRISLSFNTFFKGNLGEEGILTKLVL